MPNWFFLFWSKEESGVHLFIHCLRVRSIWSTYFSLFSISRILPLYSEFPTTSFLDGRWVRSREGQYLLQNDSSISFFETSENRNSRILEGKVHLVSKTKATHLDWIFKQTNFRVYLHQNLKWRLWTAIMVWCGPRTLGLGGLPHKNGPLK